MATGLYLGQNCPPNMEAYLDSLADKLNDGKKFDLIIGDICDLPDWITDSAYLIPREYPMVESAGLSIIEQCRATIKKYIHEYNPEEIRQITQPRWHAPGVVLATTGASIHVCTRVSISNFTEYQSHNGMRQIKSYIANNIIGRSVFISDEVYTPKYGGVEIPWWSSAKKIVETRSVSEKRFNPEVKPNRKIFTQENKRVLTVGRVSRKKGVDLVLDVADRLSDWEFAIVGPPQDEILADRAKELSNVTIHGAIDYTDMPGVYAACDVLLSASRVEWGGISRAMLEAQKMNRPIVALDRGDANSVSNITVSSEIDEIISGLQEVCEG